MLSSRVQYREFYITIKGSFPFSPRDFCLQSWKFFESPTRGFILLNSVDRPLKKGFIRTIWNVSGWDLRFENGQTNICAIWHGHSKGETPKWAEDKIALINLRNMEKILNLLDEEK